MFAGEWDRAGVPEQGKHVASPLMSLDAEAKVGVPYAPTKLPGYFPPFLIWFALFPAFLSNHRNRLTFAWFVPCSCLCVWKFHT